MTKRRVAIVLFNLGGPDRPESVQPFLTNLFTDPAILRVPGFIRPWLGRFIAWRRTKPAQENYAILGGRSPLLELTEEQARSLEAALAGDPAMEARCFVAMRYWHPMSDAVAREVQAWQPNEALLLPLYPQYSTTTTGSSVTAWNEACQAIGLSVPTTTLC
ncbi:MAG TPA: ferrochelatase, partial [Roseomonas sp.]|nr:ferrochelatase [Roseomonas sp.]